MILKRIEEIPVNRDFFRAPFFLSITIGVPFCLFKILFGVLAIRIGMVHENEIQILSGFFIIIWATADLFMNIVRAIFDLTGRGNALEFCTLAELGKVFHAQSVFLALDTLITFSIICFVLWSGWIIDLTRQESYLWYFATTLNLISLSLVALRNELIRYRSQERDQEGMD